MHRSHWLTIWAAPPLRPDHYPLGPVALVITVLAAAVLLGGLGLALRRASARWERDEEEQ